MPRSNAVFKESYNQCLLFLREAGPGSDLAPETELARLWGVSRTTVRAILDRLVETGLIEWDGRLKRVLRLPSEKDFFTEEETRTAAQKVETEFMRFVFGSELKPGAILRESELAREFGTSASAVREFLIRFSRFGLIEKEPNRHWVLRGFTQDFAAELFDVREMFETRSFDILLQVEAGAGARAALVAMRPAFERVLAAIERDYLEFPELDERFHRLLVELQSNRFVDDFFQLVSVIFHFHYRWNKADEMERNAAACREHLAVINALEMDDAAGARDAFRLHLVSARRTLMESVQWDGEANPPRTDVSSALD